MGAVVREVRGDSLKLRNGGLGGRVGKEVEGRANGTNRTNGTNGEAGAEGVNGTTNGDGVSKSTRFGVDVRIPQKVIDEGVKVVREALEEIVEVGGNDV